MRQKTKLRIQKINQTENQFLEESDKAVSGKREQGQKEGWKKEKINYRWRFKNLSN